jgi:hypothetical protein
MEPTSRDDARAPVDEAGEFDEPGLKFAVDTAAEDESGIGFTGRLFGYGLLTVFLAGMMFAILYVLS